MGISKKENVTKEELGLLSIIRLNKAFPRIEICKKINIGNRQLEYHWRSKRNLWGRFGGGWNWKLGIQIGTSAIILNILVFQLILRKRKQRQEG